MTTQNTTFESQPFELADFAFGDVSNEQWQDVSKPKARPLEEGHFTLCISDIKNMGKDKTDPTWYNLSVEVKDDNGIKYQGYVKMPTNSPVYTKNGTSRSWEMVQFKAFAESLKLNVTDQKNVQASLTKLVDGIVKGKYSENATPISVELGYTRDHLKAVSAGCYQIVDRDGKVLANAPETFSDRQSANEWYGATRSPKANGDLQKLQYITIKRFGNSALKSK